MFWFLLKLFSTSFAQKKNASSTLMFLLCVSSRETSEVLAYDAAQVQDLERVRARAYSGTVLFFPNLNAIGSLVAPPTRRWPRTWST